MSAPENNERPKAGAMPNPVSTRLSHGMPQELADSVLTALKGLEFGSVEITVHHSRIVQIERHERIRFSHSPGRDEARGSAP